MTSPHSVSLFSQRMATITVSFAVAIVILNIAAWIFPPVIAQAFNFSWSSKLLLSLHQDPTNFPWWQKTGGILISSIPCIVLAYGLLNLGALFKNYSQGKYFSHSSLIYLKKLGQALIVWVILDFLFEPLLSLWITMQEPVGHRLISLSLDSSSIIALFLSACVAVIAHILRLANELNTERQQFV